MSTFRLTASTKGAVVIGQNVKYLLNAVQAGLAQTVEAAALPFYQEARTLVPVKTGHLQSRISIKVVETTATNATCVVYVDDVPYAVYVEYGTWKMKAQPFFRPSFDTRQEEAINILTTELRANIVEAMTAATNASASARRRR